jgi:hypothetical protein
MKSFLPDGRVNSEREEIRSLKELLTALEL